ncbi:Radical SAM superfamily protein [Roseovarius litorisediminis]|uniref:Radical SAM superfamily protein n=1 Tax=Roseovarius litorisediminis TaxID=1312363 RepID=A0A1Y5TF64_9RHOB|nr:PA0069 family radical SAM protein [Roseovarius litorisediminis]SLN62677.1 Radical SAM superfamily protein [Roseovarius litorisediminis]
MSPDKSLNPSLRTRARGAHSNASGRFEKLQTAYDGDGWEIEEEIRLVRTDTEVEVPRRAITYNRSPDLPFDRSVNPYRGCEHGCIYCFARPSHAWLGMSAGLDFETRLIARPDAPKVLEQELRQKSYQPRTIAIGTNTDPYQPIEKKHEIMRKCLQVLSNFNHPVAVVSKGTLIERDIDILSDMAARGLVRVGISVTTLDAGLSRKLEPRAPAPQRRLAVIRALSNAGVPVRIMTSPIIPGLTDHEIEALLQAGHDAGAVAASWIMLRLPLEVAPLFQEWVQVHYPDRAGRIMGLVRDMHGGKNYAADWGRRMRGSGRYAEMIADRFQKAAQKLGLNAPLPPLRCDLFKRPLRPGDQLSLL